MSIIRSKQWTRILFIIIPYFLTIGIFQLIAATILNLDYRTYENEFHTSTQICVLNFAACLGTFFIVYILIKFRYKENFKEIGFQYFSLKDIFLGLILGFIIMLFGFLILIFLNQIKISPNIFKTSDLLLSFFSFVFVAFSEEIFIRGYILGNLLKCMNKYTALGISAVIFALMHAANPDMDLMSYINLFLAGLLLGAAYLHTKNLWFPIALHFSWNFFQGTIFGFNVSGNNGYSLIHQERFANNIINGGLFGFEGSIIAIIFQIISIPMIYYYYKKNNAPKDLIPQTL